MPLTFYEIFCARWKKERSPGCCLKVSGPRPNFGAQEMISLVITHKWILACFYCLEFSSKYLGHNLCHCLFRKNICASWKKKGLLLGSD